MSSHPNDIRIKQLKDRIVSIKQSQKISRQIIRDWKKSIATSDSLIKYIKKSIREIEVKDKQ